MIAPLHIVLVWCASGPFTLFIMCLLCVRATRDGVTWVPSGVPMVPEVPATAVGLLSLRGKQQVRGCLTVLSAPPPPAPPPGVSYTHVHM